MRAECEPPAPQDRIGTTSSANFHTKGRREMRTKMLLLLAAVVLLAASPALAQAPGAAGASAGELKALGEVIGLGIACGLCGIGQGRAIAGALEGMARNPGIRGPIQIAMIIGLVFIESLAIYTVALAFTR